MKRFGARTKTQFVKTRYPRDVQNIWPKINDIGGIGAKNKKN